MILTLMDTETTGLDPTVDAVAQFAALVHDVEAGEVYEVESLCDPGRPMPPEASAVNGLTDDKLRGKPSPQAVIGEWWRDVQALARGREIIICAHNAPFDMQFVGPIIQAPQIPVICTLQAARRMEPLARSHKLEHLYYEHYKLPGRHSAHDALSDCRMAFEILQYWVEHWKVSYRTLVNWLSQPIQLSLMPFGKWKGSPFRDIPTNYLSFMAYKPGMDVDVTYSMQCELARRRAA